MLAKIRSLAHKTEPALPIAHAEPCSRKDIVCAGGAHATNNNRFGKVTVCLRSLSVSSPGEIQNQVTQDFK